MISLWWEIRVRALSDRVNSNQLREVVILVNQEMELKEMMP